MEYQHQRAVPNNHDDDEKEDLKMHDNDNDDPALMTVLEKRARLAKFGSQNRAHFEKGKFKTSKQQPAPPPQQQQQHQPPLPLVRQRVNQIERLVSPNRDDDLCASRSGSISSNIKGHDDVSISPPPTAAAQRRSTSSCSQFGASTTTTTTTTYTTTVKQPPPPSRTVWRSESWRSERLPSKQRDSPENPPVVIRRASQDFIPQRHQQYSRAVSRLPSGPFLRAFTDVEPDKDKKKQVMLTFSPVPTTPPATSSTTTTSTMTFTPRQSPAFKDKDLVTTSSNEDEGHFRIVHAQSLLVPPKPHTHYRSNRYRRSLPDHLFWEAEFDSDDFSDPFYSSSSATTHASSVGSSSASSTLWRHPQAHHHHHATAAARHRRHHSMGSFDDDCWNKAVNSGSWSVDDGIMIGMNNNNNNNIIYTKDSFLETTSTNTGRYYKNPADARCIHRRRAKGGGGGGAGGGHGRRFTNQQYREEVSPFNHGNNVNNNKSSSGIRRKFPLLLCKSNKTGDDNVRQNPTALTPPSTKKGHAFVHDNDSKHLIMMSSPRLQRGHPNMTTPTAPSSTKSYTTEFDAYTTRSSTRRKSPKPHLQLHLSTTTRDQLYGAGSCHSLESETDKVSNFHSMNNDAPPPVVAMHNATILQDRMLTSSTLELLCGSSGSRVDPIKYNNGGGGGYGKEGTVSTWDDLSSRSYGPPTTSSSAIVPGAVASKLGEVFAEEAAAAAAALATVTTSSSCNKRNGSIIRVQEVIDTNKEPLQRVQTFPMTEGDHSDLIESNIESLFEKNGNIPGLEVIEQEPNDSSFAMARARILSLQQQPTPGSEASTATTTTTTASSVTSPPTISRSNSSSRGSSNNNKSSSIKGTAAPKFGAPHHYQKKSAVQLSKEKLQKQWAMDRPQTHVKKTNWYVCKKTGTYRKKVAINFSKPGDF